MDELLDLLPVTIILLLFGITITLIRFFKKRAIKTTQGKYDSLRITFFENLPAKDILSSEDFKRIQVSISSSHIEEVYDILLKDIIKEKAQKNEEVQFQLKIFLDKSLRIISNIDTEKEYRQRIINECRKIFALYANIETRQHFKNHIFLFVGC